jgi:hypothetical protein
MKTKQHLVASLMIAMKISLAQLMIALVFVSAIYANDVRGQKIVDRTFSVTVENVKLEALILNIQKATNVKFNFSPNTINVNKTVSYYAINKKISDFINDVLVPNGISYEEVNNQIVLIPYVTKNEQSGTQIINTPTPPEIVIKGTVKDESGNPLEGVTVIIKGVLGGAVTNKEGKFTIKLKEANAVLEFSSVGFNPVQIQVDASKTVVEVVLKEKSAVLNEVVVVGYGTQKKKDVTGSIVSVSKDRIENLPNTNFQQALQGAVPGIRVTTT